MHVFEPHAADVALNLFQILVNRVPGQVQPQGLPFTIQHHLLRPRLAAGVGLFNLLRLFRQYAEHISLADGLGFGVLVGGFQRIAQRIHQRRTVRTETIERPGHNQLFQHATVELFNIGPRAEVEQLAEITAVVARLNDRFDRPFADALDGADTVDDLAVVVDVEMVQAGVNIRRQNFQPHPPALVHQANDLLGVVHIGGHYRRHKLSRIVRLKP